MPDWDPEIDAPAVIAILGAGPIGIETALYARFLGYIVLIFDEAKVAQNVLRWGHLRMLTPFSRNSSSLGLAALRAQDETYQPPSPDEYLTGKEFADRYLVPLAKTDLIYENVHVHSRVVSVSRVQALRQELTPGDERAGDEFRLLIHSKNRGWWTVRADMVVDTTGNQSVPQGLAPGGGIAVGEAEFHEQIEYGIPDMVGEQRAKYAGQHTLLFGSGLAAMTTAVAISKLAESDQNTKLTWVTLPDADGRPGLREEMSWNGPGLGRFVPIDSWLRHFGESNATEFAAWRELVARAKELMSGLVPNVTTIAAWGAERLVHSPDKGWDVTLLTGFEDTLNRQADRVVSAMGTRPRWDFAESLRVARCEVTDGPLAMSRELTQSESNPTWPASADCSRESLLTTEPNYYVLGSKSFGMRGDFTLERGLNQVRQLFALVAGRHDLDLYEQMRQGR